MSFGELLPLITHVLVLVGPEVPAVVFPQLLSQRGIQVRSKRAVRLAIVATMASIATAFAILYIGPPILAYLGISQNFGLPILGLTVCTHIGLKAAFGIDVIAILRAATQRAQGQTQPSPPTQADEPAQSSPDQPAKRFLGLRAFVRRLTQGMGRDLKVVFYPYVVPLVTGGAYTTWVLSLTIPRVTVMVAVALAMGICLVLMLLGMAFRLTISERADQILNRLVGAIFLAFALGIASRL